MHGPVPGELIVAPGGLMLVGEGPGTLEVQNRKPFVGPSGKLLDALLQAASIDRKSIAVTNATCCKPPANTENKSFFERFPLGIYACQPRLEQEIAELRPRVIVALGDTALASLAGYGKEVAKRVHFDCPVCGNPPKRAKSCSGCGGYKTRVVNELQYLNDHKITFVAGGVFHADQLPSRLDEFGVKYVIATYHPSFVLRKAQTAAQAQIGGQYVAPMVVAHLQKAKRLLTSDVRWRDPVVKITTDPTEVDAYTQDTSAYYGCDIETDAKEPFEVTEIKCVGIGHVDRDDVLVVDTRGAAPALVAALKRFMESRAHAKVFQNRFYDEQTMWLKWQICTQGTCFDTMLGHHALYPDEPHKLHQIAFRYTDASPWKPPKSKGGMEHFDTYEELAQYNARDVRTTVLSVEGIDAEMNAEDVGQVHDMDMRMTEVALHMQEVGLPVDKDVLAKIGSESTKLAAEAFAQMVQIIRDGYGTPYEQVLEALKQNPDAAQWPAGKPRTPETFNPDAKAQLCWVLYDPAGPCRLIPPYSTATGQPSTEKEALAKLSHPFITALLLHRKHSKIMSTYVEGEAMRLGPDGRMHPKWNVIGARTGRWSSSPNFQNFPKPLRRVVVAPPGRKLVGADFDQLELRVSAALAEDPEMMRRVQCADGKKKLYPDYDPHSYVASLAFGSSFLNSDPEDPAHDVALEKRDACYCGKCKRKRLREATKRVVYGLNYGAGAAKILEVILNNGWSGGPLTVEIVQRLVNTYFKAFPGIPIWRDRTLREAQQSQEVRSAILRRRRYFPLGDVDATVAWNFPIQSTAADIVNTQLWILWQTLFDHDPTAMIIAQVHDAIYIECAEDKAQDVATLVTNTLTCTRRLSDDGPEMTFSAAGKIGNTWAEVS